MANWQFIHSQFVDRTSIWVSFGLVGDPPIHLICRLIAVSTSTMFIDKPMKKNLFRSTFLSNNPGLPVLDHAFANPENILVDSEIVGFPWHLRGVPFRAESLFLEARS